MKSGEQALTKKQIDSRLTIEIITLLQKYNIDAKEGVLFLRELSNIIERQIPK